MAEGLGGTFLSAFLQVFLDRLASREVTDFIKGRKLSTALLNKLETTMNTVSGLLDDAAELQIAKPAVEVWLNKLKNVVYDADDLVDEIAYESLKSKLESKLKHKVHKFFSSRNPFGDSMEQKLEEILGRLEHLVGQKDALGLKGGIREKPSSQKRYTSSVVDESDIYGRDKDKEALMEVLLSSDQTGNVGVIPIVGIGGVGKTTLAQLLYNDSRVKEQFPLRAWICVSEKYDVLEIFKGILKEITGGKNCESMTPNQIEVELQVKLKEERFFIVLDDIWEENFDNWYKFSTPLITGAEGSKIIVTTRNESVASIMRTAPSHFLEELTTEACWSLFVKHAFIGGNSAAHPDLEVIGREIVRKCGGLPLAAKTLGRLLRFKRDVEEWKKISRSSLWDLSNSSILPVLRLSYHYLPSHLKRCFGYCAIFPKGYLYTKKELVCLWMAEGFLVQPKGNRDMQDVGDEYFQDLMSRSFFQQSGHDKSCFVMHDLMHDLAESVSREFCFRIEGNASLNVFECIRHLSIVRWVQGQDMIQNFKLDRIFKSRLLRTFLFKRDWNSAQIDNKAMEDLVSSLERIRVLSLSFHQSLEEVPHSIGSLKHLRHLNLSRASIKRLPESVSSLYNLQTLTLFLCKNLIELPSGMGRLINLYSLDTRETKLRKMPPKMGNLKQLRVLTHFIIGKQSRSGIQELGKLKYIQGELSVQNLQDIAAVEYAKKADMKEKEQLKKLEFKWEGGDEDSEHVQRVFEMLQPHTNLECLYIIGYGGSRFPSWVGDFSFSNLVSLEFSECKYCSELPPLGQLSSLKDLSIIAFDMLLSVGPEFYGSCILKPFSSLEILVFERLPQWHEWKDEVGAFPRLNKLYVRECPSLEKTLPNNLSSQTIVEIEGCPKLVSTFPSDAFRVTIEDECRKIEWGKLSSGLRSLKVEKFHFAETQLDTWLKSYVACTSLEIIEIKDSSCLKCFPSESFSKLKTLRISKCPNLASLNAIVRTPTYQSGSSTASSESANFPHIQELFIINCPQLCVSCSLPWVPTIHKMVFNDSSRCLELSKLPSGLQCLEISKFLSTEEIELERLLGIFNTSEEIRIKDNSLLKCFPLELWPKLERFYIIGCPNLESFSAPNITAEDIISLGSLEIKKRSHMVSIPTEAIAASDSPVITHFSTMNDIFAVSHPNSPTTNMMIIKDADDVRLNKLASGLQRLNVSSFYLCSTVETVGVQAARLEQIDIRHRSSFTYFSLELFPNLKEITIVDCLNFESLSGYSISLTYLEIRSCQNIVSFQGFCAPNLTRLHLWGCSNLKLLPDSMNSVFPSLLELYVGACPNLCSFAEEGLPLMLEVLNIRELENLVSVDHKVPQQLAFLRELIIHDCPKLQSLPECMQSLLPSLQHFRVSSCPELDLFQSGDLPSRVESLYIYGCDKVIADLMKKDLRTLSSLSKFMLGDCKDVESFPQEMLLPSDLISLRIFSLENLKSLDFIGLQRLSSLTELEIYNCPNLQCIPKEGLPSSIAHLSIIQCPLVEQRCERDKGEDWSKIAHIPNIHM